MSLISRCSEHQPVTYVWAPGPGAQTHIAAAVDALMDTLRGNGRQWNPHAERMTRGEFRRRLEAAERGELEPVVEVDDLVTGRHAWLYEIRWIEVPVRYKVDDDRVEYYNAEVRALHGEPPKLPQHLIGVHVHEKIWWDDDDARTQDEQNKQIRLAVDKFWGLAPSNWGLV